MGISNTIPPSRLIQPGVVANTAARPTSPFTGQAIYQVDTNQMLIWNGTAWVIPNTPAQNPTGLELITTATCSSGGTASGGVITIGASVTSVTVTNAFSATYDNYLILMNGTTSSADDNGGMTLGSANTGYYGNLLYATPGSPGSFNGASDNNGSSFRYIWRSYSGGSANISVGTPFLAQKTTVRGDWITTAANGTYTGVQASSTSFTSFTLIPAAGALTGGTICVYGYRK